MALQLNARLYKLFKLDTTADTFYIAEKFRNASMREEHKLAYHVLASPDRKRVYDIGGEPTADLLQGQMWGPLVTGLGCTWSMRLYSAALLGYAVLLILFLSFLAAKVDGVVSWSWAQVASPLLALVGGAFIIAVVAFACSIRFPHRHEDHFLAAYLLETIGVIFCGSCYFIFIIVVVDMLMMNNLPQPWMKFFSLLIMGDVVYLLSRMVSKYPKRMRRVLQSPQRSDEAPWYVVYGYTILIAIFVILAIIRSVLIGLKLDGKISISWYRVFAPIACRFFFEFIYCILSNVTLMQMDMKSLSAAIFSIIGSFVTNSCIVISTYLVAAKIEGGPIKMAYALIPLYLLIACFFLASIFTAFYLLVRDGQLKIAENEARARATQLTGVIVGEPGPRYSAGVREHGIQEEDEVEDVESDYGQRPVDDRHHPFADWPNLGDGSIDEEMEEVEVDEEEEHYTTDGHSPFEGPDGYHAEPAVVEEPSLSPQRPIDYSTDLPPRHATAPPPLVRNEQYAVDSSDDDLHPRMPRPVTAAAPPRPQAEDEFDDEEVFEEEEGEYDDEEEYEEEEEEIEEEEEDEIGLRRAGNAVAREQNQPRSR